MSGECASQGTDIERTESEHPGLSLTATAGLQDLVAACERSEAQQRAQMQYEYISWNRFYRLCGVLAETAPVVLQRLTDARKLAHAVEPRGQ